MNRIRTNDERGTLSDEPKDNCPSVHRSDFRVLLSCLSCPSLLIIFLVVLPQVVPVRDRLVGSAEDGARARAVGLADEALAFERVEDGGGATVADA